jgi:hypothetical protein
MPLRRTGNAPTGQGKRQDHAGGRRLPYGEEVSFFRVWVRQKQDEIEMEAGGPGLRGAWCLPGKARWCTLVHQ